MNQKITLKELFEKLQQLYSNKGITLSINTGETACTLKDVKGVSIWAYDKSKSNGRFINSTDELENLGELSIDDTPLKRAESIIAKLKGNGLSNAEIISRIEKLDA